MKNLLLLPIYLTFTSFLTAQVGLHPTTTFDPIGQTASTEVLVERFDSILGLQGTVSWDPAILELDTLYMHPIFNNGGPAGSITFNINQQEGYISFVYFDPFLTGISLPDRDAIFSLDFTWLGFLETEVCFSNYPTLLEASDYLGNIIPIFSSCLDDDYTILSGNVFEDANGNCLPDVDQPLTGWQVAIFGNGRIQYAYTGSGGNFQTYLPEGTYTLWANPPAPYWEACTTSYTVVIDDLTVSYQQDIGFEKTEDCPLMEVTVGTGFLRRCFSNTYRVQYCNKGTLVAQDAYVAITLDPFMTYEDSDISPSQQNGQNLTFPLGDVPPNSCGDFWFQVLLDCDSTVLGQTHCVEARIFPDSICGWETSAWSGASLGVEGECTGDSVIFEIRNNGYGTMAQPGSYIVIEDAVMYRPAPFQLPAGGSLRVPMEANGSTFRVQVEQVSGHPGFSQPSAVVEGCGTNAQGEFSTGFVNWFPADDKDPFTDIDCRENRGSFDPNDKQAFPVGATSNRFIEPGTELEYLLRFQNTGSDTAFNVVLLDTLPAELDPGTLRMGVSSHKYSFELLDGSVLKVSFADIMLPDSNVNEPASHGFVRFRIGQQEGLANGTLLENSAAIYFDFNEPVITNTVFHTIGENFLQVISGSTVLYQRDVILEVYPNPASEAAVFQLNGWSAEKGRLILCHTDGKKINETTFSGDQLVLQRNGLPEGLYYFQLWDERSLIAAGKLLFR